MLMRAETIPAETLTSLGSLADLQQMFSEAVASGPEHLRFQMFAGPPERVLLGVLVHATTVNYGRVEALTTTFVHTRRLMGEDVFDTSRWRTQSRLTPAPCH